MTTTSQRNILSISLRSTQIVFSIILFVLSMLCAILLPFNLLALCVVAAGFGLGYYIPTVIPACVRRYSPALMLGVEIWLTIWWIIALGESAHYFGKEECRGYFYDSSLGMCRIGKALLAFSVLNLVLSLVTLSLVYIYSIHPFVTKKKRGGMCSRIGFSAGGIFLLPTPTFENSLNGELSRNTESMLDAKYLIQQTDDIV